jgi:hypothetical protein
MVLVFGVLLGILAGLVLGGRLAALADLELRGLPLFGVAIAFQVLAYPSGIFPWAVPDGLATALWLGTYCVLIAIVVLNRHVTGFVIAGVGMASNVFAILANGGHMPALPRALRAAGVPFDGVVNNSVAAAHPHLAWLVDRWAAPGWVPGANVYSIGDVLLMVGGIVIVAAAMQPRRWWLAAAIEPADGAGD